MSGPLSRLSCSVAAGGVGLMVACSSPTSPTSVQSISAHRALWEGQRLTNYSYTYQFAAFTAFANQPLRLEVRQDTVHSVVVLATGQNIVPTYFPTIDALFDRAILAAQNGSLTGIAFEPVRGFPTLLSYAAIPDALSSQQASALQ